MGVKTLYEYFYKLAYGDKGADKATLVSDCLDVADAEIKANRDARHGHSNKAELDKLIDGDHDVRTDNPHSVTKTQVGLSNAINLKVKLDATSAPGVSNDNTEGYAVGSRWIDITNDKGYVCLDASTGAAIWIETTSQGTTTLLGLVDTPSAYTDKKGKALRVNSTPDAIEFVNYNNVTVKTEACTLTVAEQGLILISASAPYTIGLPTAVGNAGLTYYLVKTDYNYNLITLEGNGAETFNYENAAGSAQTTYPRLNTPLAEVTIVSDGSNWQVVKEAMGQVPTCNVYLGSDQLNIVNDTATLVEYDTETYDIGSNFNTTTHKYTIPVPGMYEIVNTLTWVSSSVVADKAYWTVYFIGAGAKTAVFQQSSHVYAITNTILDMFQASKDDEISVYAKHVAGVDTVDIQGGVNYPLLIRLVSKD